MVRNGEIGLAEAKRTLRRYWWLLPLSTLFLGGVDRKSTRLNSSHSQISYAVFCLKKKNDNLLLSASCLAGRNGTCTLFQPTTWPNTQLPIQPRYTTSFLCTPYSRSNLTIARHSSQ